VTEIRVRWNIVGRVNLIGEEILGGVWALDTPENRKDYEIIVEVGNDVYGPGTHWLEEREA